MLGALYLRLLRGPWERALHEARVERGAAGLDGDRLDPRVPGTLVLVALVLVFQEYLGDRDAFARYLGALRPDPHFELYSFAWWAGGKVLGYAVVPLLCLRLCGISGAEIHLRTDGFLRHLRTYALLYALMLPVLLVASGTGAFQRTYPFYKLAGRSFSDLLAWELLYAASFVALELFYRGFLLGMLRRSLGPYAIFVMIVPYCMIHFGKPAAESIGAIFAGVVLGTLAMATRSIWGGVAIHVSIAWTMDLLSLWRQGGLPR